MNKAYLLIGGNIGDRMKNLENARLLIDDHCGKVIKVSSIYETAAWGNTVQAPFLNQALEIQTKYSAGELMKRILDAESKMGRTRTNKWEPRTIDIDIIFFNDEVISSKHVIVPHPRLQDRRFVLVPLNELAPRLVHPVLHLAVRELLERCTDTLDVKKIN